MMKRGIGLSILPTVISAWFAAASATEFGPIDQLPETYNRTASRINSASRLKLLSCETRAARYCDYEATGKVRMVATSSGPSDSHARLLTILLTKEMNTEAFVGALGLVMATWSPFTTANDRGAALKALVGGLTSDQAEPVTLSRVEYRIAKVPGVGPTVTVRPLDP